MNRGTIVAAGILFGLSACVHDNPWFLVNTTSTGAEDPDSTGDDPRLPTSGAEPGETTSTTATAGETLPNISATEASTEVSTDPTTTAATDHSDHTGDLGTTTADDTTTTTDDTTTETTAAVEPIEEHLINHDPEQCIKPLWCYSGNVFVGQPKKVYAQTCFTPQGLPPYELTEVSYHIAASFGPLTLNTAIEIYERTPGGPGDLLYSRAITQVTELIPGQHTLVLDPAPEIKTEGFCVGLVGGADGPPSGLGIAVQEGPVPPGQHYYRGGCMNVPWKDIAGENYTPTGVWCIDTKVRYDP